MALMAEIVKFQFDTSFDVHDAELAASARRHTAAEVAAAVAAARTEAAAEARRTTQAELEGVTAAAVAAMAQQLRAVGAAHAQAMERIHREAAALAYRIAATLAPALLQRLPEAEVEALVIECLRDLLEEPRVVVRAAEPVVAALKPRIDQTAADAGFGGRVVLVVDEAMTGADCRVEWADGGAERDSTDIAGRIQAAVERFVGGALQ